MKTILKNTTLLVLLMAVTLPAYSRHIIGGEVTYECLGNNNFRFTMSVYRDCQSEGAEFDDPASIAIYEQIGNSYIRVFNFGANITREDPIPPDLDPCREEPENVCVESATYVFEQNLPFTGNSYHVVYQRCCRNNTITNLVNPGDQGATYTIELTSRGQELCNNSPVFNDFPPVVICANKDIDFNHSATDVDGDQLVYEFCSPIQGGGLLGSPGNPGDPSACNGVSPDPPCAPEFANVNFDIPNFSALNPMQGDPIVNINPNTGLISGEPQLLGQFVVGVCVREFRNGELLSIVRRDFQFNVANCQPLVDAEIEHDEIVGEDLYVVSFCGDSTITMNNLSTQRDNIISQLWTFDVDGMGDVQTFSEWEPTVTFAGIGVYEGTLVLNPGLECNDTADIRITIFPGLEADFEYAYDTCVAGPVTFTDLSSTDAFQITNWDWFFGDGFTDTVQNPIHDYMIPGNLPVSLIITDDNGCMDTLTQPVSYFPAPAVIVVEPSTFLGCAPADIFFNNLSFPIDSTYDILWDFGDGGTSGEISPTHTYTTPGIYDISLDITSPIGCFIGQDFDDWIRVEPSPEAGFTFFPQTPSNFNPEVTFTDESIDAIAWEWIFGDLGRSFEQNPIFNFQDTGLHQVIQVVTHPSGCMDTLIQFIDVEPQVTYYLPNAFTPNYDDKNDEFFGAGFFGGMENFNISIWNRWGEQVFQSNDPNEGWNGQKNNTSGLVGPNGVYVVVVTYTDPRGNNIQLKGFATLIR